MANSAQLLAPAPSANALAGSASALADPAMVAQVAAKAFANIGAAWRLTNVEAADLAGVSARTWARMKTGAWNGALSQDQTLRLSALVGLFKGLRIYFSEPLADRWIHLPNSGPPFLSQSPLGFMRAGGLPAILAARNYVDAIRGGV